MNILKIKNITYLLTLLIFSAGAMKNQNDEQKLSFEEIIEKIETLKKPKNRSTKEKIGRLEALILLSKTQLSQSLDNEELRDLIPYLQEIYIESNLGLMVAQYPKSTDPQRIPFLQNLKNETLTWVNGATKKLNKMLEKALTNSRAPEPFLQHDLTNNSTLHNQENFPRRSSSSESNASDITDLTLPEEQKGLTIHSHPGPKKRIQKSTAHRALPSNSFTRSSLRNHTTDKMGLAFLLNQSQITPSAPKMELTFLLNQSQTTSNQKSISITSLLN